MSNLPPESGPPAGWYPVDGARQRYWDGAAWTAHYAPYSQPQQVVVQRSPSNGAAIASLVLGIVGFAISLTFILIPFALVLAVIGFVLGIVGIVAAGKFAGKGRAAAIAGLVLCGLPFVLMAASAIGQDREPTAIQPTSNQPAAVQPGPTTADCVELGPGAISGLQWGFDDKQPGYVALRGWAVPSSFWEGHWIVAAVFQDAAGEENLGIWATQQEPATAENVAYLSLSDTAETYTSYARPRGGIVSELMADADVARSCG